MTQKLSDTDLLYQLQLRFEANNKVIADQKDLMKQLQEVNEKLLRSEQLKTNFLSNIRNEINNPMTSILELSANMTEKNVSVDTMRKFAGLINSEIFNLNFQLRNIFISAEIEAGEYLLSIGSINVYSVIKNVIDSFGNQIAKKEIKLIFNNKIQENQLFNTDPEKFHVIISNLLSNAIQFSLFKGTVSIECSMENNSLNVVIADNGIGICESDKVRIFDRFAQIEYGSTKAYAGHGLGLCVTKALLEIMKGELHLKSELNMGSTFAISIKQSDFLNNNGAVLSADGNDFLFTGNEGEIF